MGELIDIKLWANRFLGNQFRTVITKVGQTIDILTDVAMPKEYQTDCYSRLSTDCESWFPLSHITPFTTVGACCNVEENVRSWKISHGLATSFWAKDSNEIPFAFPGNPETDCKLNPSEHKLSNVYLFGEYQTMPSSSPGSMTRKEYSSGVIYGFRQKDLHPKHIISPNLITQIPAEMTANNGMKNFQVIPEDITGQNVMKTRESSAYLLYDILALENTTYYGKIRLYLCFKGSLNHTRNMLIKQIEKDKNGHFGLTGSIPITLKEGRNQIKFVYDSNYNLNELFIDRVEIIPEKIEITIGSNGQITFTTYLDGRLEAKATNPGPLDPDGR